jgi:hypothetical protein
MAPRGPHRSWQGRAARGRGRRRPPLPRCRPRADWRCFAALCCAALLPALPCREGNHTRPHQTFKPSVPPAPPPPPFHLTTAAAAGSRAAGGGAAPVERAGADGGLFAYGPPLHLGVPPNGGTQRRRGWVSVWGCTQRRRGWVSVWGCERGGGGGPDARAPRGRWPELYFMCVRLEM